LSTCCLLESRRGVRELLTTDTLRKDIEERDKRIASLQKEMEEKDTTIAALT
jgi:predicted RNase H-like nuclease (RuvC/YqgF family)